MPRPSYRRRSSRRSTETVPGEDAIQDRHRQRRAVDLAGRGVDQPRDAVLAHCSRTLSVRGRCFDKALRCRIGVRDRNQSRQVEDDVLSLSYAPTKAASRRSPRTIVSFGTGCFGQVVQPAAMVE